MKKHNVPFSLPKKTWEEECEYEANHGPPRGWYGFMVGPESQLTKQEYEALARTGQLREFQKPTNKKTKNYREEAA